MGCLLVPREVRGQHILAHSGPACEATMPKEERLGYKGYRHCELHDEYQVAFHNWNCHCYTGQCRPTRFQKSDRSNSETGYEIFVDGEFFDIPKAAFRTQKANMSEKLLQWDAHVCANDLLPRDKFHIECAWINLGS